MVNKLREELYRAIDNYGINSPITLKISQELDKEIVKNQIILIGGANNV